MTTERTIQEKLKDAHCALRSARASLSRATQQRDFANNDVACRRVKVDQMVERVAILQAQCDAELSTTDKPEPEKRIHGEDQQEA